MQMMLKAFSRLGLMRRLNLIVEREGVKIPILGSIGYINTQGTEKWMTDVLKLILQYRQNTFVDVGVNLGQTLIKVKSLAPDLAYVGFEPNPACVFYAEQLIKVNSFKKCTLVPAGIAVKTELLTLNLFDETTDAMASIIDDFKDQAKAEKIVVVVEETSVPLLSNHKVGIIKIDVEGAELYVLQGLLQTIRRDHPFILMEILPAASQTGIYEGRLRRQNQITKLVNSLGYVAFRIDKSTRQSLKSFSRIDDFGTHTDFDMCDYLFVPEQDQSKITQGP
jgi:FkbM family methyltransferase